MSGYEYNEIDLNMIVYNDGSDNTQGYNEFPGTITTPGTSELIGINNYLFNDINLLSSRIAYYNEYFTSGTQTINIPNVVYVNKMTVVVMGASGGGGASRVNGANVYTVNQSGGASGGPPQCVLFNIDKPNILSPFNIQCGSGGLASNNTIGGISGITQFNMGTSNLTINAANGGGTGDLTGGIAGTPGNVVFTGSRFTSTYTVTATANRGSTRNSPAPGVTLVKGGYISTTLNAITNSFFINSLSNSRFDIGNSNSTTSRGEDMGNNPIQTAQNGANSYIRVYYFYN